ncbi:hypothetical protein ACP70R_009830 [Stipagrostis hirtigluma subsp. patula]
MAHAQEIQLQITGTPGQEESGRNESRGEGPEPATRRPKRRSVRWCALVLADMVMLLSGEAMAPLLGRLYYNSGGGSIWMKTLAQSAGAPLLVVPLLLTPRAAAAEHRPAAGKVAAVCVGLGLVIAFDNLMYSYAMLYLPVSTFSLVAATQLAFNAVTSRVINAQRLTALIVNSVVVLTFSAALLGVGGGEDEADASSSSSSVVPRGKRALGFVLTLSASAVYALVLSLFEAAFDKVVRARTLRWALTLQLCTNAVASAASVAGLLASGEWRTIRGEMAAFTHGKSAGYAATLVGVAVGWQAATLGAVRLIARASSLFANVTGTLALPLVPVLAVALFGDKMTGVKVVAMLMAVWGFLSYVYQHYVDDRQAAARKRRPAADCSVCGARKGVQAVAPARKTGDSDMA